MTWIIENWYWIAIIGILAAVALPAFQDSQNKQAEVPVQQTEQEKFEAHVDPDCVKKYGKFACEYQDAE